MPLPLLALALPAGLVLAAAVWFWNKLREWLCTTASDFIGAKFGAAFQSAFLECVTLLDRAAVAARQRVRAVFIKSDFSFERLDGRTAAKKSVHWLRDPGNARQAIKRTVTEEINVSELPADVQAQLAYSDRIEGGQLTISQVG
jgi:hypothetical protein